MDSDTSPPYGLLIMGDAPNGERGEHVSDRPMEASDNCSSGNTSSISGAHSSKSPVVDMDLDSVNFSVIALTNTNRARLSEGAIREEQRDAERRTNGRETWHL
jgi:hypothetical protein